MRGPICDVNYCASATLRRQPVLHHSVTITMKSILDHPVD